MNANLDPQDVVAWMRQQAKKFNTMAEEIERTFHLNGRNSPENPAIVKRITDLLSDGKARRAAQIAQEIQVLEPDVRRIVEVTPDLNINERGWITFGVESTYCTAAKGGDS